MFPILVLSLACQKVDAPDIGDAALLEVGEDEGGGNVVGVQASMEPEAYATAEAFDTQLRAWMEAADNQQWLRPDTVVVLPESIGTWLLLVDEPASVIEAGDGEAALQALILRHLPAFLGARSDAPAEDENQYALYAMRAEEIAEVYQDVMSGIAADYSITLVAGSVLLPEPQVEDGVIVPLKGRELRNVSYVFDRDGNIAGAPAVECYPDSHKQAFLTPGSVGRIETVDSPAGRLGVLVGADSWYPEAWTAVLAAGAERVIAPILISPQGAWQEPWKGYDGFEAPADVDPQDIGRLTLDEAHEKYGLPGRARFSGLEAGMSVPLRGEMWEEDTDGQVSASLMGHTIEGPLTDEPVITNLWLPYRPDR